MFSTTLLQKKLTTQTETTPESLQNIQTPLVQHIFEPLKYASTFLAAFVPTASASEYIAYFQGIDGQTAELGQYGIHVDSNNNNHYYDQIVEMSKNIIGHCNITNYIDQPKLMEQLYNFTNADCTVELYRVVGQHTPTIDACLSNTLEEIMNKPSPYAIAPIVIAGLVLSGMGIGVTLAIYKQLKRMYSTSYDDQNAAWYHRSLSRLFGSAEKISLLDTPDGTVIDYGTRAANQI